MLLTEEEAKKKLCCKGLHIEVPKDMYVSMDLDTKCKGSDCMAWRWSNTVRRVIGNPPIDELCRSSENKGRVLENKDPNKTGYCGLAGKVK